MKIYISIPMEGNLDKSREKADLVKASLSKQGHVPVSPFDIYAGAKATPEDRICFNLRALLDCDAIYLCENWQFSKGCRIEANFAREFSKEIMYERKTAQDDYYFNR